MRFPSFFFYQMFFLQRWLYIKLVKSIKEKLYQMKLNRQINLYSRQGAMAALCWSSSEEIPHAQGKRNPSETAGVARGYQKADTLKP